MSDYEYEIQGAPVVFSTAKPKPYNPLRRPEIHYTKPVVTLVAYLVINVVMLILYKYFSGVYADQTENFRTVAVVIFLAVNVIYISLFAKRALIWLVHVYQHYAPDDVRLRCVFEPSCSEYMILAIKKYGVIRGVFKGIGRLLRCHAPNGGKDEP